MPHGERARDNGDHEDRSDHAAAAGSTPCASCASQPFALIILGLGLTATINGNEADFEFVNTVVSILLFAAVLLAYGMLFPILIDRLAPRTASRSRWG